MNGISARVGFVHPFAPVAPLAADDAEHFDSGLHPGTRYFYRLRAFNGVGPTAWSSVVAVWSHKIAER
jgi:hypothetical protein